MQRNSVLVNLSAVFVTVILLVFMLIPVMSNDEQDPESICANNMKRIGIALSLYTADNQDYFPTNRIKNEGELGLKIVHSVDLSSRGNQNEFGLNWVDSISPYSRSLPDPDLEKSLWVCPSALKERFPKGSPNASTTYTFNRNLAGVNLNTVSDAQNIMMLREMDRRVNALLRPINDSNGSPVERPKDAFLTTRDSIIGETNPNLHSNGSIVARADTSLRFISKSFPEDKDLVWDEKTSAWWSHNPSEPDAIRITN